ncbi:MAG: class I SAM-dependent methyltransferase [Thiothrix sp.]|nr:class I SAM-dependent methyltransferase [Thiothrix sp.]HPE61794.1 class I SAM-dependent methyltransferase [Thiolinea sp.]
MLELASCGACGSAWFPGATECNTPYPSATETLQDPNFMLLIHHYFELVNGLDWKTALLEKLPHQSFKAVMEVGCNVGITLDYCQTQWGLEKAIGIEPSAYGIVGRQILDLAIHHDVLENLPEVRNTPFDLIFATEVLEHVPAPLDFIRLLRSNLAPQGVLLLTTPRSAFLKPHAPAGELYAALSPGSHYFLLSEQKLRALAHEAGFSFIHIEPFGMTHVAILANTELRLMPHLDTEAALLAYYRKKQAAPPKDERLKLAYLLHYAVCLGKAGQSADIARQTTLTKTIAARLLADHALDMNHLDAASERIASSTSIFDLGKQIPFNLPFYLYWQTFASQPNNQPVNPLATTSLEFARLICLTGLKVDFQNLFVYHDLLNTIDTLLKNMQQTPISLKIRQHSEQIQDEIPELKPAPPANLKAKIKSSLKHYRSAWW